MCGWVQPAGRRHVWRRYSALQPVTASLDTLEEGYGINLIPLATFALKTYENSDCSVFSIKYGADYDVKDLKLDMMMHKAIAIIQFKLEGQLILAHPEYHYG